MCCLDVIHEYYSYIISPYTPVQQYGVSCKDRRKCGMYFRMSFFSFCIFLCLVCAVCWRTPIYKKINLQSPLKNKRLLLYYGSRYFCALLKHVCWLYVRFTAVLHEWTVRHTAVLRSTNAVFVGRVDATRSISIG